MVAEATPAQLDACYGARPLHRAFERLVIAPLARWLLEHPGACNTSIEILVDTEAIHCRGASHLR
jgi:hypothetical protein